MREGARHESRRVIKSRERKGWEEIGKNKKKREKRQAYTFEENRGCRFLLQ